MTSSDPSAAHSAEPAERHGRQSALYRHRFQRLLAQMAAAVEHSALSPALNQRGELACALLDCDGYTVAEHGAALRAAAIGPQVRSALAGHGPLTPAQVLLVSDPQHGSTDLGTMTLIALALDSDGVPLGYLALSGERGDCLHPPAGPPESQVDISAEALPLVASSPSPDSPEPLAELPPAVGPRYRSFHTAAATSPSSGGLIRRRDEEGWVLQPTPLTDAVAQTLAQKQRDPIAALADLKAMRGGLRVGGQHLRSLDKRYGAAAVRQAMRQQLLDTQAAISAALQRVPAGVYAFADSLDDDGVGASDLPIRATVHLAQEPAASRLSCDFRESGDATAGSVNTVPAVAQAALRTALAALLPPWVALNDGLLHGVALRLRPDSLLAAGPLHAVSGGATETALRMIDVVLGALSQALPQPLQAASAGTASLLTLRAADSGSAAEGAPTPGRLYLRESLAGGQGARPHADGATGRHAQGARASSCEAIEQRLPVRVLRCAVRAGSGGGGVHPGGDGLVRELLLLAALHVELCGDRRRRPPYGLGGGGPGQLGRDTLIRDGVERRLPAKGRLQLRPGDILRTESPGGGGYGDPMRAAFYAALLS